LILHRHPVRVTLEAFWQIHRRDASAGVTFGDIRFLMLVAAVAGVLSICCGMAGLASNLTLSAVVEREGMQNKLSRSPQLRGVTILALQAKGTGVDFRFSVALAACGGRIAVNFNSGAVRMALFAFDVSVAPFKRKEIGVIKVAHAIEAVMTI
jgi:hypothetical protein